MICQKVSMCVACNLFASLAVFSHRRSKENQPKTTVTNPEENPATSETPTVQEPADAHEICELKPRGASTPAQTVAFALRAVQRSPVCMRGMGLNPLIPTFNSSYLSYYLANSTHGPAMFGALRHVSIDWELSQIEQLQGPATII